ncbi:MAG: permease-like cell division protein FtsX [Lysobacterales bacterium]|nr:permease-like cell division protein FtsX [Xanthomonadales bacterium]
MAETVELARPAGNRRRAWSRAHVEGLRAGLMRLLRDPFGQLLTLGVIAVALVLPALGFLALDQVDRAAVSWRPSGDLTVFLAAGEPVERALELADALDGRPEVAETEVRSSDDALTELREMSDFAEALGALDANPMPALVIVRLTAAGVSRLEDFKSELATRPEVDWVQVDRRWLERLEALLELARRAILLGAAILAVAVLLVVGNTIRLEISLKREEILILKLLGASDAHVRRPFLYIGIWYGVVGGLLALALVQAGLLAVQPAVDQLALSYGAGFSLQGPGLRGALLLVVYGAALGWLGAWLGSARHLREAEPR